MQTYRLRNNYETTHNRKDHNYLYLVSQSTGVKMRDILSQNRKPEIVEARQICQYFYKLQNGINEAGRILRRDHNSIQNGFRVITGLLEIKDYRTRKIVCGVKVRCEIIEEFNLEINF
jgi:chromosomal replication initiation ATPase DnaA